MFSRSFFVLLSVLMPPRQSPQRCCDLSPHPSHPPRIPLAMRVRLFLFGVFFLPAGFLMLPQRPKALDCWHFGNFPPLAFPFPFPIHFFSATPPDRFICFGFWRRGKDTLCLSRLPFAYLPSKTCLIPITEITNSKRLSRAPPPPCFYAVTFVCEGRDGCTDLLLWPSRHLHGDFCLQFFSRPGRRYAAQASPLFLGLLLSSYCVLGFPFRPLPFEGFFSLPASLAKRSVGPPESPPLPPPPKF